MKPFTKVAAAWTWLWHSPWSRVFWAGVGTPVVIGLIVAMLWPYGHPPSKAGQPLHVYFPYNDVVARPMSSTHEITLTIRVREESASNAALLAQDRGKPLLMWIEERKD